MSGRAAEENIIGAHQVRQAMRCLLNAPRFGLIGDDGGGGLVAVRCGDEESGSTLFLWGARLACSTCFRQPSDAWRILGLVRAAYKCQLRDSAFSMEGFSPVAKTADKSNAGVGFHWV